MIELSAVDHSSTRKATRLQLVAPPLTVEHPAPITVELAQLRLTQSSRSRVLNQNQRLLPDTIAAAEPFTLEFPIQFIGLSIAAPQQIVYRTQCQARHLRTGSVIPLGDAVTNVPISSRSSYTASLSEMSLSPGIYRLQVIVTVQNIVALPGLFNVPLLQVV